jgi:phosphohistidine phosphatase
MAPRRIILMRHAKSSWKSNAPNDHARPLNKRGRRDAPRVGAYLAELGWTPDWIVSSDSTRTIETLERMREALRYEGDVLLTRRLYHAGIREIRSVLSALEPSVHTVLLLGHNPGWEDALEALTGEDHLLKTANAALMSCDDGNWADAIEMDGCWALRELVRARDLA